MKKSKPGARIKIKIKIKIKKRGRRMLPNIDDLIPDRTIESSRIEYKGDWNPEKVLRSICAFANDIDNLGGGYIIIGISESDGMPQFPIKGIEKTSIDSINKEIIGMCNLIEPKFRIVW